MSLVTLERNTEYEHDTQEVYVQVTAVSTKVTGSYLLTLWAYGEVIVTLVVPVKEAYSMFRIHARGGFSQLLDWGRGSCVRLGARDSQWGPCGRLELIELLGFKLSGVCGDFHGQERQCFATRV